MLIGVGDHQQADQRERQPARAELADVGGQPLPGHPADPRRQHLDADHQRRGQEQRPDQREAELRARLRVGGDAARIVVGGAGDEAGPEPARQVLRLLRAACSADGELGGRHARILAAPAAAAATRSLDAGTRARTERRRSLRRRPRRPASPSPSARRRPRRRRAARSSTANRHRRAPSLPVTTKPWRSSARQPSSQPVFGSAPIITNTAVAGRVVSTPVRRSTQVTLRRLVSPASAVTSREADAG